MYFWTDYYDPNIIIDELYENRNYSKSYGQLSITSSDTYIYNCYFNGLTAYDGGAILYSGSNFQNEKCYFYHCHATRHTAGIRVIAGNCILALVCGHKCFAQEHDGFCSL